MDNIRSILIGLLLVLLLYIPSAYSATSYTAETCSRSDVNDARALCQADGDCDTVNVPAGDCNWDGGSYNGLAAAGDVSFIGAGIGNTIIRITDGSAILAWNEGATSSTFVEFSGFTIYSDLGCESSCQPSTGIKIYKTANFNISNNHWEGYFSSPIQTKSVPKGLIANSVFKNLNVSVSGSYYGPTAGSPYDGAGHPNGTANENCTSVCECSAGEDSINRASSGATGNTIISSSAAVIDNSGGSGQGKVQRIYLNLATAGESATVNIASFSRSDNVFTARARTTNLSVKAGMNIFTADAYDDNPFTTYTAFDIYSGDYIGVYLNDATVEATTGSSGWVESGDQTNQSSVDFDAPAIGAVSLWVEIYDVEDDLKDCEQAWIDWYTNADADRDTHYEAYDRGWEYDVNAIYFEDNTITWFKSDIAMNWGGCSRFIVRHNDIYTENGSVMVFQKPGNNYMIFHDNTFEWTDGDGTDGYVLWMVGDGLFYNNTIVNINNVASWEAYRTYSDFSFPFYVRPKEVYVWNNTYTNTDCGSAAKDCWYSANQGSYWLNQPGENGSIHFRAPISGERLYNFTEYTYPHPLRGEAKTMTMGGSQTITIEGSQTLTVQ